MKHISCSPKIVCMEPVCTAYGFKPTFLALSTPAAGHPIRRADGAVCLGGIHSLWDLVTSHPSVVRCGTSRPRRRYRTGHIFSDLRNHNHRGSWLHPQSDPQSESNRQMTFSSLFVCQPPCIPKKSLCLTHPFVNIIVVVIWRLIDRIKARHGAKKPVNASVCLYDRVCNRSGA